jgi:multiple sugar transport system permease protein
MEAVSVEKYELLKEFEKPPKDTKFVVALLTPGIILFAIAIVFPIVIGIFISFTNSGGSAGYFGNKITLTNYYELLSYGNYNTRDFWQYTYQTLFFAIVSLVLEFFLGLVFALILNKKFKGRGFARATILIPWAIPTVASATIFRFEIFNTAEDNGAINGIIQLFGGREIAFFGPDAAVINLEGILLVLMGILIFALCYIVLLAIKKRQLRESLRKIVIFMTLIGVLFFLLLIRFNGAVISLKTISLVLIGILIFALGYIVVLAIIRKKILLSSIIILVFAYIGVLALVLLIGLNIIPNQFQLGVIPPINPPTVLTSFADLEIKMTMFTVIIIDVWKTTPFITLLILATLSIVPQDLYQAGDIAGASGWQKFRYITWPLIKPGVGIALIFRMMQALRVYDAVVVFNDESVYSMTSHAVLLWQNTDYGKASAISVLLLVLIGLFALFILLFTRRAERTSSSKKPKSHETKKLIEERTGIDEVVLKEEKDIKKKPSLYGSTIGRKIEPISQTTVNWYIWKRRIKKGIFIALAIFMCLFCAAPFIWIVLRSFRNPFITQTQFELFPQFISLDSILLMLWGILMCLLIYVVVLSLIRRQFRASLRKIIIISVIVGALSSLILIRFALFPEDISFGAYQVIFVHADVYGVTFDKALLNGFILSGTTVVLVIIVGSLIAYAIAKFKFRAKGVLNSFIFSMNSLPPLIIIIPFYIQIVAIASILPFIDVLFKGLPLMLLPLPYAAFNLPLAIFILIAFFREIPEDLWKAAKVDGAKNFQIFRKVILPLTIPGIFTCAILVFIASWNELLFAQIFLAGHIDQYTVPVAILRYLRNPQSLTATWNTDIALLAATTIATLPLVIVVLIFQKKIVSGLTRGAVKG